MRSRIFGLFGATQSLLRPFKPNPREDRVRRRVSSHWRPARRLTTKRWAKCLKGRVDDAERQRLRISTGALIGFGARTVEVPKSFCIDQRERSSTCRLRL